MTDKNTSGLSASEVLALLDAGSDEEAELGCVDLEMMVSR